ncbi:MAG: hypothetical protein PHF65_02270 [Oscillospiraceae bacterium]|nr:hypothetical protein [Oscillospiraceae bacterium]
MIKVIAGAKGTGKTARLVDDINEQAIRESSNIVCIERGNRLDRLLKYQIRLIDVSEYYCNDYGQLLAFICGVYARDYDLTHLYIDSIYKVAQSDSQSGFGDFLDELEKFLTDKQIDVSIICSSVSEGLDPRIAKYC